MKNILITGGAGFIGSNLAKHLVSKGYNVTVFDNLSKQVHGDSQNSYLYKSKWIIWDRIYLKYEYQAKPKMHFFPDWNSYIIT